MRPGDVAVDHIIWSLEHGLSPHDAIEAIGWLWDGALAPTWNDVEQLLVETWRRLPDCDRAFRAEWIRVPIEERFPVIAAKAHPELRRVA